MRRIHQFRSLALTGALLAAAGTLTPVRAQDPDDLKRAVARISLINGDVNVRRGDSGDWVAGVINAPLLTGDHIATGPSSRAEVQFDASNTLRIGANAEVNLAQLEYGRYQVEMARGLATFRMLRNNDATIEIDTPSVSVRPSRQGSVRISVNEAGETEVTARNGDVEVFTPRGSHWVRNGQTLLARGSATDPEFQVVSAGGLDDWDRWCDSRDRTILQSNSSRYVGQGVYGAEELDAYGSWDSVPEYGYVWHPTVAADWSPYHYGRWSWVDWYGWTWVSADPWGWAPYHYGRWFRHDRFGWCWYPGLGSARHYWSPGLVAFFGFGGGGGIGFGFGNVGWVPLAPYEVYHPWWGRSWYRSGGYFNHQVNIVNVNIANGYRNSRYNGISAVGYHDFSNGRFNNVGRFNGSQIQSAGLIRGAMPFTPGSQNLRFSDRNVGNVPRTNDNARFFRHETPNPAQRVPFNQQVGRASGTGNVAPQQGGFRGQNGTDGQPGGQAGGQAGWRRFGSTAGSPAGSQQQPSRTEQAAPRQQDTRGGWQRFGTPGGGGSTPDQRQQQAPRQQQQQQAQPRQQQQDTRGGWQRFGGSDQRQQAPRQESAPAPRVNPGRGQDQQRQEFQSAPRSDYGGRQYNSGGGSSRPENIRIAPPVVRERPSYSPPRQSAPSYSAPRQSAPSYSPPARSNGGGGGGGGGSAPRGNPASSGGGGRQSSGGGGGHGRR